MPGLRLLPLLLVVPLVLCALALVTSQYRVRDLNWRLEQARTQARALELEAARLRLELGHAAQPAAIEGAAARMGMRPVGPERTVLLPAAPAATPARSTP